MGLLSVLIPPGAVHRERIFTCPGDRGGGFLVVVAAWSGASSDTAPVARLPSPGRSSDRASSKFSGPWCRSLIVTGLFIVTVRAMVLIDAPQDSSRPPDLVDHRSSVVVGRSLSQRCRRPLGHPHSRSRRLLVRIESADVIHDFWVPDLARKMDAVPGRVELYLAGGGHARDIRGHVFGILRRAACLDAVSGDRRAGV